MNLYEIDAQLRECLEAVVIDEETGEILEGFDPKKFEELSFERDKKLEAIGIFIKELDSEIEGLKAEAKNLKERADRKTRKRDFLKVYLGDYLQINKIPKFETSRVALSFRKSDAVEADEDQVPKKYFKKKIEYALDKVGIKKLLKAGIKIKGAQLVEKQNLQIK